ncbi:MAG: hypothetical protein JEZ06_04370 [Anaerolineaceae bacterium]|nr:hypothetical protein [Anaerolineaceae bacterium]
MQKERLHFPEHIWYRVPEKYAPFLSTNSNAFLVAGLLAGMYFGEDIEVRGTTSPRLAYHLEEYQHILNFRMPNEVKPVKIHFENLSQNTTKPSSVGSTFTGGVDSLYTIWEHLPPNQPIPQYQVTHGLFIHGFDILHHEKADYQQLFNGFRQELSRSNIELIEIETNMNSIIHQRLNLSYYLGPLIISAGLVLDKLFHRFYVPSSWDYAQLQKKAHTSDPLVDNLLSTETMEIIHHGSATRRIEKVESIADWEIAQKTMWVCLNASFKEKTWNCSRCDKCVRTMIPLYALGKLRNFVKFEKPITRPAEILWYARKFDLRSNYVNEMFPYLQKRKPEFLPWLALATIIEYLRYLFIKFLPGFIKQFLRRFGYFKPRNDAPDAYEVQEINQIIKNSYDHSST